MPTAAVNGTELWYQVQGEGEPILLLPGLGLDHNYYRFGEPLLREKLATILVDPRGLGEEIGLFMGLFTLTREFMGTPAGQAVMQANQAVVRANSAEHYTAFIEKPQETAQAVLDFVMQMQPHEAKSTT